MSLVMRFSRFLALLILNFAVFLLSLIFRLFLLPFLMVVFRALLGLIFLSFMATISGPHQYMDRLAGEWTQRFVEVVNDRSHIDEAFQICRLLVAVLIVLGWLVTSLFIVEILRVYFAFFI
jgi:hypothetical protein